MASVLLIDDHPDVQEIMSRLLSLLGHQVQVCANAEIAVDWLDENLPEVVIVDDRLPGMSGLDFLKFMRKGPATATLPVILISADPTRASEAIKAGATDFWVKGADWVIERMAHLDSRIKREPV
jgi:CheY-like chemotaxis protein